METMLDSQASESVQGHTVDHHFNAKLSEYCPGFKG